MESAEQVKKKRVRHCYPRLEVYHRWIHSPEYVYSNQSYPISGKGNYIQIFDIGKDTTIEDIENGWSYRNSRMLAVIDRDNKKIIISRKYRNNWSELYAAIPSTYEIFWCLDEIPDYDILSKDKREILCKIHLEAAISIYTKKVLTPFYNVLQGKTVLSTDINNISSLDDYFDKTCNIKHIKQFVKKYKVKRYSWYNKSLNDKFKFNNYFPNSWSILTIELSSVKKIITEKVFSKSQKELFEKRYFYTKYCYGKGISWKDVNLYWKLPAEEINIKNFFNKRNCYWIDEYTDASCKTWNDFVIRFNQVDNNRYRAYIEENQRKSKQNFLDAQAKANNLLNGESPINLWRSYNNININRNGIEYKRFIPPTRRNKYGSWIKDYVNPYYSFNFENTQLRLTKDKERIETSRGATVPFKDGIIAYKYLQRCIKEYNESIEKDCTPRFVKPGYNIGIYPFESITYINKFPDKYDGNRNVGDKQWLIQIGCHNLWLDDIDNFIHYYHLEKEFGIEPIVEEKKNK